MTEATKIWYKALEPDELPEGRVKAVTCGLATVCMTHYEGQYGALDNECPHQRGPLGEGSIEKGFLRCPWHGWDFHPLTGKPPGGYDDGIAVYSVENRADGIYVAIEEPVAETRTVSDLMAETMTRWGVRAVFGIVGHSNLGLAEAIRRQEEAGALRYFGVRHEGAASFAASAYGKLTGRPAACFAIAGPGATNLLTGLWDANVDRAPVLALTGQVDTSAWPRYVPRGGPSGGVWQGRSMEPARAAREPPCEAREPRAQERPIEPRRLASHLSRRSPGSARAGGRRSGRLRRPRDRSRDHAASRIARQSPRASPGLEASRDHCRPRHAISDGACSQARRGHERPGIDDLQRQRFDRPDTHPLGCGVLGRSGTPIASWFMNESDVLVVFGASFSDHTGITPKKPTIQVDLDPMMLGKFHSVEVPVWGEIGVTASLLREGLGDETGFIDRRSEVAERWAIWREEKKRREADTSEVGLGSAAVFAALNRHVPKDAIITVDVGNNTYSFGRYFECESQAVLMSGYLGSIGFALPAAMGAWAATQESGSPFHGRPVVSISGDGGFGQYMAELTTAVKYDMNITHMLLNNNELGKISKEQRAGEWKVWETSLVNPNFAEYAKLCGAKGIRVESPDTMDEALKDALAHEGPALVEIVTDALLI